VFRRCWSSKVCWVTGATYSTDYFEEYLSRRLPALRRQSVLPSVIETLNFGFTSLSTDYVAGSFWITKITYVLRTSFPLPVFVWIHIKLAVSCYFRLLDQTVSVPCPPSNVNICTPESFLFAPSSHRTAPKEPSTNPTSTNLVPESFFPWRPDHTYLSNSVRLTNS
ncbi:hypothetical protein ATANTOWER_019569, partial [Ataeniobius toweri]|nr:hypothetical protein [Ataeniobius toweri]